MKYTIISKNDHLTKNEQRKIKEKLNIEYNNENPDIIIAIGGDGTFLRACKLYPDKIIFGYNTGKLGFYCNFSNSNLDELVDMINSNNISYDNVALLEVRVNNKNLEGTYLGLNELTIISTIKTLDLEISINNKYFETIKGSGLCVSTPSGSSAYNRSLGGAILDHNLVGMQLTEIAGIHSSIYKSLTSSLILSVDKEINIKCRSITHDTTVVVDNTRLNLDSYIDLTCKIGSKFLKIAKSSKLTFIDKIHRSFVSRPYKYSYKNKETYYKIKNKTLVSNKRKYNYK